MKAHSSAFADALTTALAQSNGNRPPPASAAQQAQSAPEPVFVAMFRNARASARANLKLAQSRADFDPRSPHAVTALQSAQHQVEEVERQIDVARRLVVLAQDVATRGTAAGAWIDDDYAANLARQAAQ